MDCYYSATYSLPNPDGQRRRFATVIKASPTSIEAVVRARNLGETDYIDSRPFRRLSPEDAASLAEQVEEHGVTPETMHRACFVGFLALKSGVRGVEEILGDTGLIHEMAHHLDLGEVGSCIASREELASMARRIERAIPGYPSGGVRFRP
ncbi:MAG: hypothetical protein OXH60_10530 [Rhodospirillales bacterium]|nr:hypothetical protein [Rhodospirillales bacterium]